MTKQEPPSVEARVKAHYDEAGWIRGDGTHAEDKSFRVFRPAYADYHAKSRQDPIRGLRRLSARPPTGGGHVWRPCRA